MKVFYFLYPRDKEQLMKLKIKIYLAHSNEEYPASKSYCDVICKALDYYNDNFVKKEAK